MAVGAVILDLAGYTLSGLDANQPISPLALILLVLPALPLLAQRRHPLTSLAAVLALGLTVNLSSPVSHHFGAAVVVALFTVARTQRGAVTAVAALACCALSLVGLGQRLPPPVGDLSGYLIAAALVVTAAVVFNRYQREVEIRRRLLADRAVASERRRIARELHDIVAHHITTMQLMAGGARANLGGDTEVVRDALTTLEGSGRMALREMRQLLDVLRAGDEPEEALAAPQPGTGDLARIVEESRLAGLPTEFTIRGEERPLPPSTGLAVYRIVQESLTNARKHASRAQVHVQLTYRPDRITVEVRDDGTGPGAGTPAGAGDPVGTAAGAAGRSGYGLIGMRERVALQGGSLVAGRLDGGGFRVAASLPLVPVEGEELLA
ncbi:MULTISPECIES: sensor histidine kinase [unclassified Kitasatospora]|uniref:sensor histidine kinase n=1 Tax=unclassified Kitasatospora TaxID=2633591 RepID=UPI002475988F|nr:sensor histidine kinase [Kitasatospora sp. MAP12-44]